MIRTAYLASALYAILCCGIPETACLSDEPATEGPRVADLLPTNESEVDVMWFPERFVELMKKLDAGVKENPGAFMVDVLKAKPGEPIDYDPRLGLTEEEYNEFLRLSRELKFVKLTTVPIKVHHTAEGVELDGGDLLPQLTGITFDPDNKKLKTPFGVCTKATDVRASDEQTRTGRCNGVQWECEQLFPPSRVRLMLGKLEESGRGLLIYDARGFEGFRPKRVSCILTYDLPPAK